MGVLDESRMSISEVAKFVKVCKSTVDKWVANGVGGHKLEAVLLGGKRYTSKEALGRFLRAVNKPAGEGAK